MNAYLTELKVIMLHKWYFLKSARFLGLPWRVIVLHDWSKFLPIEFANYAQWFYGERSIDGWVKAWRHHAHHNKHHPEHWILSWRGDPDFYNDLGRSLAPFVTVLEMPEPYVREMVADFMAASKVFTGSYDIAAWLNEHGPQMNLHPETIASIHGVMQTNGRWMCTDNCPFSFVASEKFREWDEAR